MNIDLTRKNSGVENAFEETAKFVAYPGTSEHQTGMALDILSLKYPKGSEFPIQRSMHG